MPASNAAWEAVELGVAGGDPLPGGGDAVPVGVVVLAVGDGFEDAEQVGGGEGSPDPRVDQRDHVVLAQVEAAGAVIRWVAGLVRMTRTAFLGPGVDAAGCDGVGRRGRQDAVAREAFGDRVDTPIRRGTRGRSGIPPVR